MSEPDQANGGTASDVQALDFTDAGKSAEQSKRQPSWPQQPPISAFDEILSKYDMKHKRRGYCLIFNQVEFSKVVGQARREGSDVDARALEGAFGKLGFEVKTFKDATSAELGQVLVQYSMKTDHSDCDCFALVLLSHGYGDYFYAKDNKLRIDSVTKQFMPNICKSLGGKPKLFFIQACRGDLYEPGFDLTDGSSPADEVDAAFKQSGAAAVPQPDVRSLRIPLEADFCFFYSTPPGYFSWRNSVEGSWFVQQLAAVLIRHGNHLEFQQAMLLVQRIVATNYQSNTGEFSTDGMKQMPVVVSQLRKLLFFRDK